MKAFPAAALQPNWRTKPRNKYLSIVGAALQQAIAYRFQTFVSILANVIAAVVAFYVWHAVFSSQDRVEGFTWEEMRTYTLLSYSINAMIGFAAAGRMMSMIREGHIVVEMIRPVNYLRGQLATTLGGAIVEGVISFFFVLLLGLFAFDMQAPVSGLHALFFVAAIVLGFLTKFLFIFVFSTLVFWTTNQVGLNWAQTAAVNILGGVLVPIQFLPGWLAPIAEWSPLRGIVATPVGVYLGQYGWTRVVMLLCVQVAWVVVLWLLAEWVWPHAFRAVEVQGG